MSNRPIRLAKSGVAYRAPCQINSRSVSAVSLCKCEGACRLKRNKELRPKSRTKETAENSDAQCNKQYRMGNAYTPVDEKHEGKTPP